MSIHLDVFNIPRLRRIEKIPVVRHTDRTTTAATGLIDPFSSRDFCSIRDEPGVLGRPLVRLSFQAKCGGGHDHSWAIDATAI